MPELRRLRQFVVLAEELHFGRAAKRLSMTQPPLSMQIRNLEEEVGAQLFFRTKRHVALTGAGEVLLTEARRILALMDRAFAMTERAGRGEIGSLRIGFVSTADYSLLPPLLLEFRKRYPEINLSLRELTTDAQLRAFADGDLDVGFVVAPIDDADTDYETIFSEPLVAALPEAHALARSEGPVAVRALANEGFISSPRATAPYHYDKILAFTEAAGFTPRIEQVAVQMQTIVSLVSAGLGVAIVPACMRNLQRSGVVYRDLHPSTPIFQTAIAWPKKNRSVILEQFVDVAREHSHFVSPSTLSARGARLQSGQPTP